jgi:hydrogenase-4 component F
VLRAGFRRSFAWAALLMAGLLIVIFIGFLNHFRAMYFEPAADAEAAPPLRSPGGWCIAPMWLALAPLLVLGLWWPQILWEFFRHAARLLSSAAP